MSTAQWKKYRSWDPRPSKKKKDGPPNLFWILAKKGWNIVEELANLLSDLYMAVRSCTRTTIKRGGKKKGRRGITIFFFFLSHLPWVKRSEQHTHTHARYLSMVPFFSFWTYSTWHQALSHDIPQSVLEGVKHPSPSAPISRSPAREIRKFSRNRLSSREKMCAKSC